MFHFLFLFFFSFVKNHFKKKMNENKNYFCEFYAKQKT